MREHFNTGISLHHVHLEDHPQMPHYPSSFSAIELTAGPTELRNLDLPTTLQAVHLTDCFPPSLTQQISEQPEKMVDQFIDRLSQLLSDTEGLSPTSISIDFAFDLAIKDTDKHHRQVNLLKQIMPLFYRHEVKLCLPIRIPFISPDLAEYHLSVLTELMNPLLAIEVNIHPHELGKSFMPGDLLCWIKYDLEKVRFLYELDLGNVLTPVSVRPWWQFLKTHNFKGSVLFVPSLSTEELFVRETDFLKKFVVEIDTSENSDISPQDQ